MTHIYVLQWSPHIRFSLSGSLLGKNNLWVCSPVRYNRKIFTTNKNRITLSNSGHKHLNFLFYFLRIQLRQKYITSLPYLKEYWTRTSCKRFNKIKAVREIQCINVFIHFSYLAFAERLFDTSDLYSAFGCAWGNFWVIKRNQSQ